DEPAGEEAAGEEAAGDEPAGEEAAGEEAAGDEPAGEEAAGDEAVGEEANGDGSGDHEDTDADGSGARRARWLASGTGAALALAGLAAALLRLTGGTPPLVPVAYACGAAVCALAGLLGSRGRTRRALWLLIAGLMVMALGDQFD
ncbi:hypothetical protein, partial [Streptomyces thermospinosisporus]